jgi:acetoin utilization deacetylase AcuC-like enzyme
MRAFYSGTFVLPLPEHHRFPMAKYRSLRERLVDEGVLVASDQSIPEPIGWDDLRLAHDAAYVDAVATGSPPQDMQRRIGFPWSPTMVERSRPTLPVARTTPLRIAAKATASSTTSPCRPAC